MPLAVVANNLQVLANAVSANLFLGNIYEYLERPSIIEWAFNGSAAGLNIFISVAGKIIVQDQPISAANRFPIVPDDFIAKCMGPAGGKLFATLRNTTAGNLNAWVLANITPVS